MGRKKKPEEVLEDLVLETADDVLDRIGSLPVEYADEEPQLPPQPPAPQEEPENPEITDPEWNAFALSHFLPDEMDTDSYPTADGLRRVVELLLGPIVEIDIIPVEFPTAQNGRRATAKATISISFGGDLRDIRKFSDVAEVNPETNPDYVPWAFAAAATKAEGRALRKALRLRKVLAAEEKARGEVKTQASPQGPGGLIDDRQLGAILKNCRDADVNFLAFINNGELRYDDPRKIPYERATTMCKVTAGYFARRDSVPDNLKGYDPNWESK